jgi:AraC family transcriptional regulator of adaptative response/methylated-DNA-[protein]-cysteine methyltransferase
MVAKAMTVAQVLAERAPGLSGSGSVPSALFPTPWGPMLGAATDAGVCLLEFTDRRALGGELKDLSARFGAGFVQAGSPDSGPAGAHLALLARELEMYLAGTLRDFTVALDTPGTEFERRVWGSLRQIPYGSTVSYGALATKLGNSAASRAVGGANGRNRIAIVIPCHRVIQEDGTLGGYGGGLVRKRALLELEGSFPAGQTGLLFS